MSSMGDPSHGVHRELLSHVHLVSTFRYTTKPALQPNEVTSWLMQAPTIARDKAPFYWTYLERPENGHVFLTWQPLQLMGTNFASDGYIWPPGETLFTHDVGQGVMLEMYLQKSGFSYGDQVATHSRRRFRLIPPSVHNPNAPQVDPSLWIVHYGPAEPNDRIPAQMIPRDPRTQQVLETRAYLHRCGQIQRKEFILGDRVNWPQIGWPREPSRQPMYPQGNRGVPQAMAYPPHAPAPAGPPSKRARTSQAAAPGQVPPAMPPMPPADGAFDDEEDTSRGDMFDNLMPREVSLARYQQNHEWMEEILSSPYRLGQLGFADLGLGLLGELSGLTEGFFQAQGGDASTVAPKGPAVTHLDPQQAAAFRNRVEKRIQATNDDIEKLKADHARKMAKFQQNSLIDTAEKELRGAVDTAGQDPLPLDGNPDKTEDGAWPARQGKKVDEIVSQVEAHLGRRAQVVQEIRRIQDGGYQQPAPEPEPEPVPEPVAEPEPQLMTTPATGAAPTEANAAPATGSNSMSRQPSQAGSHHSGMMMDTDIDMGGTAAGLLDQMHTGLSANSTPVNNFPTPQAQASAGQSNAGTPANAAAPSPQPAAPSNENSAKPEESGDAKADDSSKSEAKAPAAEQQPTETTPDQGTGSGDWVVVPKESTNVPANDAAPAESAPETEKAPAKADEQTPSTNAPAEAITATANPTAAQNDFGSLDLDPTGDLGDGLMMDIDGGGAFDDAFTGVESQTGAGEGPSE